MNPLVDDLVSALGLTPTQATGVVGLLLAQLQKRLSRADFQQIREAMPDTDLLLTHAPTVGGGGVLGGIAALGGDRARLLLELNQGLNTLHIPAHQARAIGDTLVESLRRHDPTIEPLLRQLLQRL